jgi:hypothetical protein
MPLIAFYVDTTGTCKRWVVDKECNAMQCRVLPVRLGFHYEPGTGKALNLKFSFLVSSVRCSFLKHVRCKDIKIKEAQSQNSDDRPSFLERSVLLTIVFFWPKVPFPVFRGTKHSSRTISSLVAHGWEFGDHVGQSPANLDCVAK